MFLKGLLIGSTLSDNPLRISERGGGSSGSVCTPGVDAPQRSRI